MKILEDGILVGRKLRCINCNCLFKIESGDDPDILTVSNRGYNDMNEESVGYNCPQCRSLCMLLVTETQDEGPIPQPRPIPQLNLTDHPRKNAKR